MRVDDRREGRLSAHDRIQHADDGSGGEQGAEPVTIPNFFSPLYPPYLLNNEKKV
jgi:hypothetical protein